MAALLPKKGDGRLTYFATEGGYLATKKLTEVL